MRLGKIEEDLSLLDQEEEEEEERLLAETRGGSPSFRARGGEGGCRTFKNWFPQTGTNLSKCRSSPRYRLLDSDTATWILPSPSSSRRTICTHYPPRFSSLLLNA